MDRERKHVIVVAEDDPLLRLDARLTLEDEGFEVIEAANAPSALAAIEAHGEVEALFTDVQMPGAFCGLALARRAHDLRPELLVFVTSGEAKVTAADLPKRGRFFAKPYEIGAIARELRAAVA